MIHLDTNLLIALTDPHHPHRSLALGVTRTHRELAASSIAWWEFICGPVTESDVILVRNIVSAAILPFTELHSREAARLFNAAGRARRFRFDSLIAATAILAGAELATVNPADFQIFVPNGLKLLVW